MTYYVYILSNNYNTTLYVGVTNNFVRRVYEHKNHIDTSSFTAKYNVEKLVYYEIYSNPDNYPKGTKIYPQYLLTVHHKDGSVDNYNSIHLDKFMGGKEKMIFKSQEDVDAAIAKFKESVIKEGDEVNENDESLEYVPQPSGNGGGGNGGGGNTSSGEGVYFDYYDASFKNYVIEADWYDYDGGWRLSMEPAPDGALAAAADGPPLLLPSRMQNSAMTTDEAELLRTTGVPNTEVFSLYDTL